MTDGRVHLCDQMSPELPELLAPASRVNHHERVNVAVAIVVVGRKVDGSIRGRGRVLRHDVRSWYARGLADPEVAIRIPREGLGKPVQSLHLAHDIVSDLVSLRSM